MTTNEFRRGNIVTDGTWIFSVEEIQETIIFGSCKGAFGRMYGLQIENLLPIVLTEDWLSTLGCRHKVKQDWWKLPKGNPYKCFRLMLMANGCGLFMALEDGNYRMIKAFDYVHELQNLCFALTENELILSK